MLITYGRFGVYATAALVVNALMILGIMAIFNASLTLPGIAGFVLTIGAAVDANVLINERIREEQRRGRKILDAIETGYKEASTAIFDANITNVIAAVLMWYFGSGPIRGFAVVLMIGIVTSVFTAVNFTRMLVALWVRRKRPSELILTMHEAAQARPRQHQFGLHALAQRRAGAVDHRHDRQPRPGRRRAGSISASISSAAR